jgi:hypothetical protein
VGPADPAPTVQPRQDTVIEKSADVLEEIWRITDHNRSQATFTLRADLLRRLKATLGSIKGDLFGERHLEKKNVRFADSTVTCADTHRCRCRSRRF